MTQDLLGFAILYHNLSIVIYFFHFCIYWGKVVLFG